MSVRAAAAVGVLGFAVIALCALPALLGGFVYDDQLVRSNALFYGWENLWAAFARTSHDYMPDMLNAASGSTYRPMSVASLVLTSNLFGREPLPHHLVSLALHMLTCALIALLGYDFRARRVSAGWLVVTALFALHPLVCETYQWISGRNDLLAGCALAATAVLLRARLQDVRWAQHNSAFFAVLLFGALCKEPFLIAASFLVLAELQPRRLWPVWLALALTVAVSSSLRALTAPAGRSAGAVLRDPSFLLRIPRALALAVETLLVPAARPMRSWSWELEQPWSAVQASLLGLALATTLLLLCRRQLRATTLLIGAAATLAPSAAVADYFWLGLDRYVHLPFILLICALASAQPLPANRRVVQLAAACAIGWLAVCSWLTATSFAGQAQFAQALIRARPDDPSGYLVGAASVAGPDSQAVVDYLHALTERDLPPAFVHAVVLAQSRFGLYAEVTQTLERAARQHPHSSHIRFDLLELRGAQHRFSEGLELSDALLRDARLCPVARAKLLEWDGETTLPPSVRERLRAQLNAHPCG